MQISISSLYVLVQNGDGIDITNETLFEESAAHEIADGLNSRMSPKWRVISLTDAIAELTQEIERAALARATAKPETPAYRIIREAFARRGKCAPVDYEDARAAAQDFARSKHGGSVWSLLAILDKYISNGNPRPTIRDIPPERLRDFTKHIRQTIADAQRQEIHLFGENFNWSA